MMTMDDNNKGQNDSNANAQYRSFCIDFIFNRIFLDTDAYLSYLPTCLPACLPTLGIPRFPHKPQVFLSL